MAGGARARKAGFPTSHDLMVKVLFGTRRRADFILRTLLADVAHEFIGLPEPLDPRFAHEWLGASEADLVFRYSLWPGGCFYILLEHKSGPSRVIGAQMLDYHVSMWRKWGERPHGRLEAPLAVLPVILHSGAAPWHRVASIAETIQGDGAAYALARAYAPRHRAMQVQMHDEPLLGRLAGNREVWAGWAAVVAGAESRISLKRLDEILSRLPGKGLYAQQVSWYLLAHCMDPQGVVERRVTKALGDQEGRKIVEGVQHYKFVEGRALGVIEGRAEGKAETLLKLLRLKFRRLSAETRQRVETAPAEQLDAWAAAVLSAGSLEEVFASKA